MKTLTIWRQTQDVAIDIESHGREEFSKKLDLAQTVGWFTSLYPVYFNDVPDSLEKIITVIQNLLQRVPNGGIGYGLLHNFQQNSSHRRDLVFNYWGQFDGLFSDLRFSLKN